MANGSFYNYPKTTPSYFGLYCEYTFDTNNADNYTNVTVDVYLKYWTLNIGETKGNITVGGTSKSFTVSKIYDYSNSQKNKKIASKTIKVSHNTDGTKKDVKISVSWNGNLTYSGKWYSTITASKTVDLPTIPRASTIDSLSCSSSYFNGTLTYKYTPKSASYYNKCNISLNLSGTYIAIKSNIKLGQKNTSQQTGTISLSPNELNTIYNNLPSTTKGTLRFTFRTYSDSGYSKEIGSASYKEVTLDIPDDIKPSLNVALNPHNITTQDGTSRNILVQSKNKLRIEVTDGKAGIGSTIKSYTFSGPSISETKKSSTATSYNFDSSSAISKTGDLTYTVKITDARGRTASTTKSITCYSYAPPSFTSFAAYRCNASGTADDNGQYVKYSLVVKNSSVNNTNNFTVQLYWKLNTSKTWTSAANALTSTTTSSASAIMKNTSNTALQFSNTKTYSVYAVVTDNYGTSVSSQQVTIFSASKILNIRQDGNGIAFGKIAESDNLLESKWPAKFDEGITVGVSSQSSVPTGGIHVHDVRNAAITPDSFGNRNVNFYFDKKFDKNDNADGDRWQSVMHVKGWDNNWAAWELAGNGHNSSNNNTLRYRQGCGSTWGDWQTVLTNKNIGSYAAEKGSCLPLSGGTLTGPLKLNSKQYYASNNTYGLDCQNSDIVNANGIYFNDGSDTAGEAINFYRYVDDNNVVRWDSLYAYNGKLKFHTGRATSAGLDGYTIYNSSNFRRGTCTLSSSSDTTVSFSSDLGGAPTVILTPLTETAGVIPGKVKSTSKSGFTAIIGGSAVSSAKFAYLAIYY